MFDEHEFQVEENSEVLNTSMSREIQTSLPCLECEIKKDKVESLQKTRSKYRQRISMRNKHISDLQKENKNLRKVGDIYRIALR